MIEHEHEAEFQGMEGNHAVFRLSNGVMLRLPATILEQLGVARTIVLRAPPKSIDQPTDPRIERLNRLIHEKSA